MIELERHGGVTRAVLSTRRSRLAGYSVSVFLTRGVMVDTGFPGISAEMDALLARERPAGVVLTHQHEDHAGNLPVAAARGLPVAASAATLAAVRAGEHAGLYRRLVWGTMPPVTAPLADFEPDGLALLPTPGHCDDHHAVWDAERETLFAGDLFLSVKVRIARPAEDPRAHVRSLRAAAALRPRVLFDSHRGLIPDPVAALSAKADWIEETVAAIDRRIAGGWSDAAIAREVLGAEDWIARFSAGDLSRLNLVRAARRTALAAPPATRPAGAVT